LQPPKIRPHNGNFTAPVDVDANGIPILNSAGDPFDRPPEGTFYTTFIEVRRNQPFYDLAIAVQYAGKINSDNVTIPGVGTLLPGQMLCHGIEPTSEYSNGDPYVNVATKLELAAGVEQDGDKLWDGFKYRILDAGYNGWYDDSGTLKPGPFWTTTPVAGPSSSPVLLDGTGKPRNANFKIGEQRKTPVTFPSQVPPSLTDTGSAVFIKYARHKAVPFAPLRIGY
jgi:hypothetical protein